MHKIIDAADTTDGRIALTIQWPDGDETIELVSPAAAKLLGFEWSA